MISRPQALAALFGLAACAAPAPPAPVIAPPLAAEEAPERPLPLPGYVLDDLDRRFHPDRPVALGDGAEGVVVDGRRVVVRGGEPLRVVADPVQWKGGAGVPARLGGGVLLWTEYGVYRAEAFEAPAAPLPVSIERVTHLAFGPSFVLLGGAAMGRTLFRLPSGALAPADGTGLVVAVEVANRSLLVAITGGPRPRVVAWGVVGDAAEPLSAVELPSGEVAVLVSTSFGGAGRVLRLGKGGNPAVLATLAWTGGQELASPNPPSLALGPGAALSILITPSGGAVATADDPALAFLLPDGPPLALAPWSTVTSTAPGGCPDGDQARRAIVRTARTWVDLPVPRDPFLWVRDGMLARVRWGQTRACVEALAVPTGTAS